jgi:hypothetical protein
MIQITSRLGPVLWGQLPMHFEMEGGKVTIRPRAEREAFQFKSGFAFEHADSCLTVTLLNATDPTNSFGGLLFWVKDKAHCYVLNIASIGYYQARRKIAGQRATLDLIGWTETKAVNQGPDQSNILRMTLKSQSAINSNDFIRFRAQPPEAPSFVGLYSSTATAKRGAGSSAIRRLQTSNEHHWRQSLLSFGAGVARSSTVCAVH